MATTTINTDITITVIKQSINGAWLITDGIKQAWARPASRREDGTWTPSAYKALQLSETNYITSEEQAKLDEEWNDKTNSLENLVKPKFKVGDRIRHKETNKHDVYEISKVYDDSYGITGFTWMIYMKYQDQYELVLN